MLNAVAFLALLCTVNAYFVVDVGDNDNDVLGKENSEVRSCNLRSCEQTCSRLGFPGGVCIGDKCKCDIIRAPAVHYKSSLYASCSPQGCAQSCRRIGFPGGACVGDRCKCDIL